MCAARRVCIIKTVLHHTFFMLLFNAESSANPRLVTSESDGSVAVYELCESDRQLRSCVRWKAHELEAWIAVFDQWNTQLVMSGVC